jgi:hypothetical protein
MINYHNITNWMQRQCLLDTWTFWHTIWGAIGARVLVEFMSPWRVVLVVFVAGVVWEIYELARYRLYGYSRWQLWANNTGSDLFVETLAAVLVVM